MKLKCDQHNRRVMSGPSSFLHRTGDQSKCESATASMRDTRSRTTRTYALDGPGSIRTVSVNKEY